MFYTYLVQGQSNLSLADYMHLSQLEYYLYLKNKSETLKNGEIRS
jgi:hypothetical protein